MNEAGIRLAIVEAARAMNALGINQGTSGNISVRCGGDMLITPSATPYETMAPGQIAAMPLEAADGRWRGPLPPSTEWRFHHAILRGRPEAGAVVHTHAAYCTALSLLRRAIPAVHYMIVAFGGSSVRCAPYATFGTAELADLALTALEDRSACLLANHGMIVLAPNLSRAMWLAVELETLAKQYLLSLQAGTPVILTEAELAAAAAGFARYGLQDGSTPVSTPKL